MNKPAFDPKAVKVKRQLVFPVLKIDPGQTVYFTVKTPIVVSKQLQKAKPGEAPRKPANIMQVVDKVDGVEKTVVVNKALSGILDEQYADASYVGKSFQVTKGKEKKKGGDGEYYNFEVSEIE